MGGCLFAGKNPDIHAIAVSLMETQHDPELVDLELRNLGLDDRQDRYLMHLDKEFDSIYSGMPCDPPYYSRT